LHKIVLPSPLLIKTPPPFSNKENEGGKIWQGVQE
jgi:hypothetical protein